MAASRDPPPFTGPAAADDIDQGQPLDIPSDDPPPYEPPAYEPRSRMAAPDPDEILDPCTLVLRGRFIYRVTDSPSPTADGATTPAEYQLTNPIHEPGIPAGEMVLQRLDPRVRMAADGTPVVARRAKDIYRLEHRRPMPLAGIPAEIWLEPLTRKALGAVRLERSPVFFHSGYRAVRVRSDAELRALRQRGVKVKKGEYWFAVKGGRDDCWEWSDDHGAVVARQVREAADPVDTNVHACARAHAAADAAAGPSSGPGPGGDVKAEQRGDVYSLKIVKPLSRRERDSLVALWCLWMWHHHIEDNTPKKTWEDRKRILHKPRQSPSSWYL
ncbi:hypothetical protein VTH06DRAFT_3099 [Thermothelomyces fergusii]